jgi:hypothetical protein
MPSPKSSKPVTAVEPAAPVEAQEADVADPGEVSEAKAVQKERGTGKYGSAKVKPHKGPETPEEEAKKTAWIEIELIGEDDKPIPGETYRVTMADGTVDEGTLDGKGFVRIEGIEPGSCKITFPNLDKDAWEKI